MSKNVLVVLVSVLIVSFFCLPVFAEVVVLKSGRTIEGKIVEKTDDVLRIRTSNTIVPYLVEEIESIDGKQFLAIETVSQDLLLDDQFTKEAKITRGTDRDGDGIIDSWIYVLEGDERLVGQDHNNDSKPDAWEVFKSGSFEGVIIDSDFDGKVDRKIDPYGKPVEDMSFGEQPQ